MSVIKEFEIGKRLEEIRRLRGWKQTAVADEMKITQQAYSSLVQTASNARVGTLLKFCKVFNIDICYLLSAIPITEETFFKFGRSSYETLCWEVATERQKVLVFEELILRKGLKDANKNTAEAN